MEVLHATTSTSTQPTIETQMVGVQTGVRNRNIIVRKVFFCLHWIKQGDQFIQFIVQKCIILHGATRGADTKLGLHAIPVVSAVELGNLLGL